MKNFTLLLVALVMFAACQNEAAQPSPISAATTKELKLVSYRVVFSPAPATYTGDAMPIQESIFLKDAINFYKTRTSDGVSTTVLGTYTKTTVGSDSFYILVYKAEDEHVCTHSGSSSNQERLKITTTGAENFTSDSDGPDLTYEWAAQ